MSYLALILLVMSCSLTKTGPVKTLKEASSSGYRTKEFLKYDHLHRPLETLIFFDISPNHTVLEIDPGAGRYMEIIAPLLQHNGKYIMAMPYVDRRIPITLINEKRISHWLKQHLDVAKTITIKGLQLPDRIELGAEKSADRVVSFTAPNWISHPKASLLFEAIAKVLRPGGVLGLAGKNSELNREEIILLAKNAGLRLLSESELVPERLTLKFQR
jgi:predicted methyltransferase